MISANGVPITDVVVSHNNVTTPINVVVAETGGQKRIMWCRPFKLTIVVGANISSSRVTLASTDEPSLKTLVGRTLGDGAGICYGDVLEATATAVSSLYTVSITKVPDTSTVTGDTTITFTARLSGGICNTRCTTSSSACNVACTTSGSSSKCCTVSVGAACADCSTLVSLSDPGNPEQPDIDRTNSSLIEWASQQDQDLSEFIQALKEEEKEI